MITLDTLAAAFERLGHPAIERDDVSFIVGIMGDEEDEVRPLEVRVMQSDDPRDESPVLVRFIAGLPWRVPEEEIYTTRLAAHECTEYLVFGHFEVDDDGVLMLVHTGVYANDVVPSDDILDQIYDLMSYQQLHFGDYFEQLLKGAVQIENFFELVEAGEQIGIG